MKRAPLYAVIPALACISVTLAATPGMTRGERQLNSAVASLDKEGSQDQGQPQIVNRLEALFGVDQTRIDGLRADKLGFGEIAVVLSLAQKMPGGITDANVQSILTMRSGTPTMGWGQIAAKLGEKLGPVLSQVSSVERGIHPDVAKGDHAGAEHPDKGDRPDAPARPDHPEKPEHPERPVRP
jgi:hypothetical protein